MYEEIKTLEELRGYNGRKITCTIEGTVVDDCLVSIEGSKVYLLQNEKEGNSCRDLKGYKYSWVVEEEVWYQTSNIYPLESVEQQLKYYYKDSPKKPTWFDGRPVLVRYSDESEEDAIESDNVGWLVQVDPDITSYPYRVFNEYNTIKTYIENAVDLDYFGDYSYVVPVVKDNEELKVLRKQRDEIDRKIAKMEREINNER